MQKYNSKFKIIFFILIGLAVGVSFSVFATSLGTNLTVTGNMAVSGTTGTTTIASSQGFAVGTNQLVVVGSNGNVGIGTTGPLSKLDINGGVAIGSYAGSSAAPSNGLIVSGNVGIGTTTPDQLLSIYSATTPSLEFSSVSGPTNKWTFGIDTADANKFKIASSTAVGTNTRLTIDGSGNIGIGTTTPNWLLQEAGTRPFFALSDTSAGANLKHWYLSSQGGNLYVGTTTDAYATTTGYQILTLNGNGTVGFGTTNPQGIVDVVGSSAAASSAATANGSFFVGAQSVVLTGGINSSVPAYSWLQSRDRASATYYGLSLQPNGGNVGIGTTSPDQLLSIYSATTPSLEFSSASGPTNKWTFGIDTADANKFKIASSTAVGTNTRLTIDGSGNVGVGTSTPAKGLATASDIFAGSAATTTLFLDSSTANKGGCIQLSGANGSRTMYRAYATTTGPLILELGTCQ